MSANSKPKWAQRNFQKAAANDDSLLVLFEIMRKSVSCIILVPTSSDII